MATKKSILIASLLANVILALGFIYVQHLLITTNAQIDAANSQFEANLIKQTLVRLESGDMAAVEAYKQQLHEQIEKREIIGSPVVAPAPEKDSDADLRG